MAEKLTLKQEAFVLAYLQSGNATEAYRQAYNPEKMSEEAINVEACRLLKNPKVALRLRVISNKAEVKALLSLEDHMSELLSLRELGKQNNQVSAAIKAEELRGKLRRFYVEQHEHGAAGEFGNMDADQLREFIAERTKTVGNGHSAPRAARGSAKARGELN